MDAAGESITLARFFIPLREPIPVPDGEVVRDIVRNGPNEPRREDDPGVTLVFHQVDVPFGRTRAMYEAVDEVLSRCGVPRYSSKRNSEPSVLAPGTTVTVVEAVTSFDSPDDRQPNIPAHELPPRSDSLNRCLLLISDIARLYRISSEVPYEVPTYERLPATILCQTGAAKLVDHPEGFVAAEAGPDIWGDLSLLLLEHYNLPDLPSVPPTERVREKMAHWYKELRFGSPFILWREKFLDARRLRVIEGDTAGAVVLALTSSEILIDSVLSLIYWESGLTPEEAAEKLAEGQLLARIKSECPRLLKGSWTPSGDGVVARWVRDAHRLRHRAVHGGYVPSRAEADAAIEAVFALEKHTFNRLAEKRGSYPRTTLMCLGQQGLERRNMWRGRIREFAEKTAPTEPSWADSFREWRRQVIEERLRRSER